MRVLFHRMTLLAYVIIVCTNFNFSFLLDSKLQVLQTHIKLNKWMVKWHMSDIFRVLPASLSNKKGVFKT